MEKYLRELWAYNNDYDRKTIAELKHLENQALLEKQKLERGEAVDDKALQQAMQYYAYVHRQRYEQKAAVVTTCRDADHQKDRLVATTPVPKKIRCHVCGRELIFQTHTFKNQDKDIVFIFACPEKHLPKRMVYANGQDFPYPPVKRRCPKCNGPLIAGENREGTILLLTDTCNNCGYRETLELDEAPEPPIDEAERQHYCLTPPDPKSDPLHEYRSLIPFLELVEEIMNSPKAADEAGPETTAVIRVQKIGLPQLEERLVILLEKAGFTKIRFDPPAFGDQVRLSLLAYDTIKRSETQKLKLFRQTLNEDLLETNWRLDRGSVGFRLGCLQAQLTGYDREADLKKLAEEVRQHRRKNAAAKTRPRKPR